MSELELAAKDLGLEILQKFQKRTGDLWQGLDAEDKEAISRTAKRFAKLSFDSVRGKNVEQDLAVIEATLENYAYVGSQRIYRAFWETANEVVGIGANFLKNVISSKLV